MNVLMQLRKVCNHPDLFEERPIVSPHEMRPLLIQTAGFVLHALESHPLDDEVHLDLLNLNLAAYCDLDSYDAVRTYALHTRAHYIVDVSAKRGDAGPSADLLSSPLGGAGGAAAAAGGSGDAMPALHRVASQSAGGARSPRGELTELGVFVPDADAVMRTVLLFLLLLLPGGRCECRWLRRPARLVSGPSKCMMSMDPSAEKCAPASWGGATPL